MADIEPDHTVIGKLIDFSSEHLLLSDADLHDCRKANSVKEVYISEASNFGININRREVAIPRSRIIAISKLDDASNI